MDYRKWANQLIEKTAEPKRKTELKAIIAERLGIALPTLHARLRGDGPDFDPDQVEIIAEACGDEVPPSARVKRAAAYKRNTNNVVQMPSRDNGTVAYPILGDVKAGSFSEADLLSQVESRSVSFERNSSHPNARPMAWIARDNSMNNASPYPIHNGMIIFGVDFQDAGGVLTNGLNVVIEQNRGGLIERSAKAVAVFPDRTEFQPRSTEHWHKPIILKNDSRDDGDVKVLAIIHAVYGNMSR